MSLDGCDIVVIRNTPGATWKKTNHIRITHPDSTRVLVPPNVKTINVMVRTGKDLEDWYYQMLRASRLTSKVCLTWKAYAFIYYVVDMYLIRHLFEI